MHVNVEDFAHGVLLEAMPGVPADVLEIISDDIAAGEFFSSLIELIERAPHTVSAAAVDIVARHLLTLPESSHRTVGLRVVATHRDLLSA
jgi:hypothetical protein